MTILLETPQNTSSDTQAHQCVSCDQKERVYVVAPNGRQTAGIWRCRVLSQKKREEVIVQPEEDCFVHRSLSDYWQPTDKILTR